MAEVQEGFAYFAENEVLGCHHVDVLELELCQVILDNVEQDLFDAGEADERSLLSDAHDTVVLLCLPEPPLLTSLSVEVGVGGPADVDVLRLQHVTRQ